VLREPKVLMLDEATSALDEDSQKKVQSALEAASRNRTTIIIAHRMSTIEKCDKIFVLESGSLMEEGNFNELKERRGTFAKLAISKK
jgi:ABC-type multidrug transport system fused ATPase/permease subunit